MPQRHLRRIEHISRRACCTSDTIISERSFALYDAPLWNLALIASRLHLVWIATVCGRLRTDFSLFQHPRLEHLSRSHAHRAEQGRPDPLRRGHPAGARGAFPGDDRRSLRSRERCRPNLREAHERNDEVLERIYIGRRFKNDTERLEKLFELYTKMTARQASPKKPRQRKDESCRRMSEQVIHSLRFRHLRAERQFDARRTRWACGRCRSAPMQKRGEQYLLIKSPPASGKSRALMFIALDKLANQGLKQAIIVVPETIHRRQLPRRAAEPVRLLGGLEGRAEMEPLRRAGRRQRRQGECGEEVSGERRQGAGLHPRDLPLRRGEVRRRKPSTTG